ncbi:MAG: glucose-6-phosphate dehydrogenase [Polyangiaceae bacterium]|nr:glucose-6-phosphate dehydrogenase [Polyangiaceae bacterium]
MSHVRKLPEDCLIVIFGASGDLTKRKLIPALYALWSKNEGPKNFAVIGVSRTTVSDQAFRNDLFEFGQGAYDKERWQAFAERVFYHAADATNTDAWGALKARFATVQAEFQTGPNLLFYLAMAPQFFEPVIRAIGASNLVNSGLPAADAEGVPWQRIVVEKPFGHDPTSAARLNRTLAEVFREEAVYRIDHYLGKELVQNLMVVRFANSIFEPIWNRQYIDHVQITASETVGVEGRGAYYDGPAGGALRDMVQSHLLQVLAVVAMEPPVSLDDTDIRTEKIKIFKALRVPQQREVAELAVRGQYGAGQVLGKHVDGYRENPDVNPASQTDTYAAVQFHVDTWRWGGVPFYLRSGKAMARKKTEIVLYFKPTPHCLFREHGKIAKANQIVINVNPNEGIRLRFEGKVPGIGLDIQPVVMDFDYEKQWKATPKDGYETLLSDCLRGDLTNFKHRDEVEASWSACQPVLDAWAEEPQDDLPNYAAGTWGPPAADLMMAKQKRYFRND